MKQYYEWIPATRDKLPKDQFNFNVRWKQENGYTIPAGWTRKTLLAYMKHTPHIQYEYLQEVKQPTDEEIDDAYVKFFSKSILHPSQEQCWKQAIIWFTQQLDNQKIPV